MRVELSNDNWAELRDPATLTNGQRKPLIRAMGKLPRDREGKPDAEAADVEIVMEVGETVLAGLLEAWSFGPLPSENPTALDDLLASDYDLLQLATGKLLPKVAAGAEMDPTEPSTP